MKNIIILVVALYFVGVTAWGIECYATAQADRKAHRTELRHLELQVAEIKARLATFEVMGVQIDVIDHTGIWMVGNVEVDK